MRVCSKYFIICIILHHFSLYTLAHELIQGPGQWMVSIFWYQILLRSKCENLPFWCDIYVQIKSSTKIWSSNIRRYLTELSEKNLRLEDFDQCYKVYTTSIRSTLIKSVGVKVTSQISNYYEKVLQNPPYSVVTTTSQLFWFKSIPQANHCR